MSKEKIDFIKKNERLGLGPATLLKKRLSHRCFPVNILKFLKTPPVAAFGGCNLTWYFGTLSKVYQVTVFRKIYKT